jgi:NodT family efflux transporter outer membrane factor (OMF) lipoprotein
MNSKVAFVFGAAVLMFFANACAVGPKYARPDALVPPAFKEELPAGWKDAQPSDEALRGKWWTIYNDPGLNALEDQVSISNQNVLAAEAQFREAKAQVRVARAGLSPSLTVSPSVAVLGVRGSGVTNLATIPVDLNYPFDLWGSIRQTVTESAVIAQAAAAQRSNVQLLFQTELASDYFQIQGLDASHKLLDDTVKSYVQNVQLTQDRYEGGVASLADVAQAQTQLESARLQLTDLGVQRAQFEHAIAVLTGKPPADLSIPELGDQSPPPATLVSLPSALLERRPDIAIAERQVAAANEQIGIAKSAFYPSLNLVASGGVSSTILDLVSLPNRFWSLGPQLTQTILDGGKRRAQVQVTEASYDATVANYRQTVLTAFQQVEDSLSQLRILSDESEIADRAVKAAQQSLDISTIQYRSGTVNYLQVITAQTSTLQNQRSVVDLFTRRMVASVSLIQVLGGGWEPSQMPTIQELKGSK